MTRRLAILVTTYQSGAPEGRRMGTAGYSYDFVVRQFLPLLKACGELVELPADRALLESHVAAARRRGLQPIHLCFMPFQHACLSETAPNVVVPAWEFPDVPDHGFDGNPQNDWVSTANRCTALIVGGPWTETVFRRAGIRCPIHIVPVPTPSEYFSVPRWSGETVGLHCRAIELRPTPSGASAAGGGACGASSRTARPVEWFRRWARAALKRLVRPLLPARVDRAVTAGLHAAARAWKKPRDECRMLDRLELSGVVYTSIFNPDDGRKNWEDLVSAYLLSLRDQPDATLVLKLIARDRMAVDNVLRHYSLLNLEHRCRVVIISEFLTCEQMLELARGTTWYITSTRAEGNCLPLMDYLAAGRPAVAPKHTAISDYFSGRCGFIVDSHPEPAAWPQDLRLRCRTTWNRMVWSSLAGQIAASYEQARHKRQEYERQASSARQTMLAWSHPGVAAQKLRVALEAIARVEADETTSFSVDCLQEPEALRAA